MTIYKCRFFNLYILSLVFLSLNVYVNQLILSRGGLVYRGLLEYVVNACAPWFLMKDAASSRGRCFLINLCTIQHLAQGIKMIHPIALFEAIKIVVGNKICIP